MQEHNHPPRPRLARAKQSKHVPGQPNYIAGRSILTHPDPQALLDEWSGRGTQVGAIRPGLPGSKERVDFRAMIGIYIDPLTGHAIRTARGIIVYDGRGRAHIIPARP